MVPTTTATGSSCGGGPSFGGAADNGQGAPPDRVGLHSMGPAVGPLVRMLSMRQPGKPSTACTCSGRWPSWRPGMHSPYGRNISAHQITTWRMTCLEISLPPFLLRSRRQTPEQRPSPPSCWSCCWTPHWTGPHRAGSSISAIFSRRPRSLDPASIWLSDEKVYHVLSKVQCPRPLSRN